jgi:hypothetical protein
MKKIILAAIAVLALTAGNVFADYKWFAGGSFDIATAKDGDTKASAFGINPSLGYIIDDNSDVSVSVGFRSSSVEGHDGDKFDYSYYSISAGYERLILTAGSFYFYIWGGVEYSSEKFGDADAQGNFNINITPNVQYGLTDNIILFVNLNFLGLNFDTGDGYNDFSFGVDTNNALSLTSDAEFEGGYDSSGYTAGSIVSNSPITIGFSILF